MEEQTVQPRLEPVRAEVRQALGAFSPLERIAFMLAVLIGTLSVLALLYRINEHFMVAVPIDGGTLNEGIVGTPRFVNPLLAVSEADRDLTSLVYRGLMKVDASGDIVTDLADSYEVSKDGLTYTFTLRDAVFHDGEPVTADDVVFTIKSAQDPLLKSAKRVAWEGVAVNAPDQKTVTFTLKQSYAPFLENTTLGILPKHIWSKISYENWAYTDYNAKNAIGQGPYYIKNISQNSSGIPDYYELERASGDDESPLITSVRIHFYASESAMVTAYKAGDIDALGGIDPATAQALAEFGTQILTAPLPRVFGLFFNETQAKIFADKNVRKAVSLAINKDQVVGTVLASYGAVSTGPIPASSKLTEEAPVAPAAGSIEQAKTLLEKNGWKLGSDGIYAKAISKKETQRLSFQIATNDTPELTQAVDLIAENLKEAGIEAIPKVYETGSLNQDIIRPRKFQALFFGEVVSNQSDLYAFWHSSQRNDPGLNISGYTNSKADKLLEQGLATLDPKKEANIYEAFLDEIATDIPAVFVYSPSYIYAVREGMTGITLGNIATPEDRFNGITSWYLATSKVWKVFANN
jgi:peptide/nickel transport system substrate-binding protein